MNDQEKTREELIEELQTLRKRLSTLENKPHAGQEQTELSPSSAKAEEALRDSAACLSAILEQLPVAVGVHDRDGEFILTNSKMHTYAPRTIPSRDPERKGRWKAFDADGSLLPPEKWASARALRGEVVYPGIECQYTDENEREVWALVSSVPYRPDGTSSEGAIVVIQDITERKQTKEAFRRKEEEFRALVENAPDVISLFDRNLRRIYVSSEIRENTGRDASFMMGKTLSEAGYPESFAQPLNAALENVFATGREETVELDYEAPKGRIWLQIRCTPLRTADGSVERVLTIGRDITERKRTEEALRESEERLRLALRAARAGAWSWDIQTGGIVWSEENYDLYGLDPVHNPPSYKDWEQCLHPDDVAFTHQAIHDTIEGRRPEYRSEFRVLHPKLGLRWLLGVARVHYAPDGTPLRMFGINMDITARKQAEEALRLSEQKFALAFSNNPAAIAMSRLEDGLFLDVNDTWVALNGYSREEAIGRSARRMNIWPTVEAATRFVRELREKGSLRGWEQEFLKKSGEVFVAQLSAQVLSIDDDEVILSTLIDTTERKRIEEALRESERQAREQALRLQAVLDATPAFIWTALDRQCRSITGNRAAIEFSRVSKGVNLSKTGPEPEQLAHYRVISKGKDLAPEEMPIQCVAASGKPLRDCPLEFLFDDGTKRFLLGNVVPFVNLEGEPEGAVAAFLDITERKQMEEELRRSRDELEVSVRERTAELTATNRALTEYTVRLERLNEELQEFAFVASHDLQEPLRKIQTFGHMLSSQFEEALGEEGQDYLMRMTRSAHRMSELLRSLLDYSRIATRPHPFVPTPLDQVVSDSLAELELILTKSGARIEVEDLPTIEADAVQLRQLFQNLISNAIRFGKASEPPLIHISRNLAFGMCQILVQDNGIGFDERYVDRIFKPFQQLHGKSAGYGGTGMGLAICRKIAERHGGGITAKSVPGQGSAFIVTLPVKQSEAKRV